MVSWQPRVEPECGQLGAEAVRVPAAQALLALGRQGERRAVGGHEHPPDRPSLR